MTIPNGQRWLINYMNEVGYDPSEGGICFGVAKLGMQAFQAGEIDLLIDRFNLINNIPLKTFKEEIENARDIRKKKYMFFSEVIRAKALKKLDIIAFFEEIILLHQIHMYPYLFKEGKAPTTQDAWPAFKILKPRALQEKGGAKLLESFSGAYETSHLEIYFKILQEMAEQADFPISLILDSINHTIHVGYDRNKKTWVVINATYLGSIYISDKEIKDTVSKAFSKNGVAIFNTSICVTQNNYEKASKLFKKIQEDSDWQSIHTITTEKIQLKDSFGASLLHIAAKNDNIILVQDLIDKGADINAETKTGYTPLHYAASKGHINVVKTLLDSNVNVNAINSGMTPLHAAVTHGHLDIAEALLNKHANIIDSTTLDNSTALHIAVYFGYTDIVKFLLGKGADVKIRTVADMTPLHIAVIKDDINCVTTLLEGGADVNVTGRAEPPLYIAAKMNHANIITALINKGVDINAVLLMAISQKEIKIIETLINNGADLNAADINGDTPLHHAVIMGDASVINCLLDKNVNVNAVNNKGENPLFLAAEMNYGHFSNNFKALLDKSADIDTTLYIAATRNSGIIFQDLIDNGANISTALYIAAEKGDTNAIEYLLNKHADINKTLQIAVQKSNTNVIKILLNNGANINAASPDRDTPLVIAAQNSDANTVKILLENSASIKEALHIVAEKNDINSIKFLLDRVTDLNTILKSAKQNGHSNIVSQIYIKMLTNHCTKRDKEKEYKTSYKFFNFEFNFGISKTEEFTVAKLLQEVLEGSKPVSYLKDHEKILNDTESFLKPIYDKIKVDIKFDNMLSIKNTK